MSRSGSWQVIEVRAVIDASPSQVFALLGNSATWPDWTPIDTYEPVQPPGVDGLGEVRRFRNGRTTVTEQIVERVPDRGLTYVLLAGLALTDYRARITLEPHGAATDLCWYTTFRPRVPGTGWLYRRALLAATRAFVEGLSEAAPRAAGPNPTRATG
jgi:hypothetical protein